MNKLKWTILVTMIAMYAVTAGVLNWLRTHQRLGAPGIKATPIPGEVAVDVDLPAQVLDFTSERIAESQTVLDMLPKDTSYAQRRYKAADGFEVGANIVLMGADRTSIHKPEYCLPGQGWRVVEKGEAVIPIAGSPPYDMPVAKWVISNTMVDQNGARQEIRGLYIFWFVAHNEQTVSHWQRIWWLARDLLRTGVLQRWAYVSYLTLCEPGQEDAAFERVKKLIAASVPEFQEAPGTAAAATATVARQ